MFAGMVSAIALLFAQAPAGTDPLPQVSLDTQGGYPAPEYLDCRSFYLVKLDASGDLWLAGKRVALSKLGAALRSTIGQGEPCDRVYLAAEEGTPYLKVVDVLAIIKNNGFDRVGLIAPPEDK